MGPATPGKWCARHMLLFQAAVGPDACSLTHSLDLAPDLSPRDLPSDVFVLRPTDMSNSHVALTPLRLIPPTHPARLRQFAANVSSSCSSDRLSRRSVHDGVLPTNMAEVCIHLLSLPSPAPLAHYEHESVRNIKNNEAVVLHIIIPRMCGRGGGPLVPGALTSRLGSRSGVSDSTQPKHHGHTSSTIRRL